MFDLKPGDPIPLGIYFGLDEDTYHKDPDAVGSSPIKEIHVNVADHQYDKIVGKDEVKEFDLGSALHARILEGRTALNARFAQAFDPELYPDAMETVADLTQFLEEHDQRGMKGKRKADLIRWVLEIDENAQILDLIAKDYLEQHQGKTLIKKRDWILIETAAQMLQKDHLLGSVMEDGTFINGAPEVSIFYMDGDIKRKLRIDQLMRHALVDLKSFSPQRTGPMVTVVKHAITKMYHEIQAADYLRSFKLVRELYLAGEIEVFGEPPYETFLDECFEHEEHDWIWVFVKTKSCPQPLVVNWTGEQRRTVNTQRVVEALDRYRFYMSEYGPDEIWHPQNPAIDLDDEYYKGNA